MRYRPEIDGLRAVAVLSVLFTHYPIFGVFAGGSLGIDMFFVISGYLITSILLRELAAGTFSFLGFWERRVRRILPALFTVLLATTFFVWIVVPVGDLTYAQGLIAAVLFFYNFVRWFHENPNPLLFHAWTLSVEEQFYILFPVLLFLLWRFARKHLLVVLIALGASSLIWMTVTTQDPAAGLLSSRAWQLLAGGVLAVLEAKRGRPAYPYIKTIMPAVGLFLIFLSMSADDAVGVGRVNSLTASGVVGGTMLTIWFAGHGDYVSKILSSKPFVAVGLISYSLYLWNWPLVVAPFLIGAPAYFYEFWGMVLMILLSFVLSGFTWFCVERPFRDRQRVSRRALFCCVTSCALFLVGWGLYMKTFVGGG